VFAPQFLSMPEGRSFLAVISMNMTPETAFLILVVVQIGVGVGAAICLTHFIDSWLDARLGVARLRVEFLKRINETRKSEGVEA